MRGATTGAWSSEVARHSARTSRAPNTSSFGRWKPSNQAAEERLSMKPGTMVCGARRFQGTSVVAVYKHAATARERAIDGPRQTNRKALHAA